jgi:hypothetical protein
MLILPSIAVTDNTINRKCLIQIPATATGNLYVLTTGIINPKTAWV